MTADAGVAARVIGLGFRSLPVVETAYGRATWGGDLDAVAQLLDDHPVHQDFALAPDLQPGGVHHG